MLECPVCHSRKIAKETCQQCGTDLRPLIHTREFPRLCFQDAIDLLAQGNTTEALELLNLAVSLSPEFNEARLKLAEIYLEKGWHDAAIEQLDRAAEVVPVPDRVVDLRKAAKQKAADQRFEKEKHIATVGRLRRLVLLLPPAGLAAGLLLMFLAISSTRGSSSEPALDLVAAADRLRTSIASVQALQDLPLDIVQTSGKLNVSGEAPSPLHVELVRQIAERVAADHVDLSQLRVKTAETETAAIPYRIRPGDTLWRIAARNYGHPTLWTKILEKNKDRLTQPDRLSAGQELFLYPITVSPR